MTGILWAVLRSPLTVQPLFSEGRPHHVTLQYGVERDAWEEVIGLPMTVFGVENCWSDRIQAVKVILPPWVQCQNPHPHITVSWVPGATPVESNAMFAGKHQSEAAEFPIHTVIEWLEWGKKPERVCSICGKQRLRSDNKTGVCSRCQPRIQPNSKYRGSNE